MPPSISVIPPKFIYGTAWKEDDTHRLTSLAIQSGFRGIDTANQRKHYVEADVGEAIQRQIDVGLITRDELFIQTKFTHLGGQDHRLPYDAKAPIYDQVEQSFARSLDHLRIKVIDSYVLHGPSMRHGLSDQDWKAWRAIEDVYLAGKTRSIGVSNVSVEQLALLIEHARVKPHCVQNRCFASLGWDNKVRQLCKGHGLIYQGFSLLTANRQLWQSKLIRTLADQHNLTPAQVIFSLALDLDMLPLTGTTHPDHMIDDLQSQSNILSKDVVSRLERCMLAR